MCKQMKQSFKIIFLLVVFVLLAACGSSAGFSSNNNSAPLRIEKGSFVRDAKSHLSKNEEHVYTYKVDYGHGDVYGSYRFALSVPIRTWNPVVTLLADGEEVLTADAVDRIEKYNNDVIRVPDGIFLCTNKTTNYEIIIRGKGKRDAGDYTISFVPLQSSTKDLSRCMTLDK